MKVIYLASFNAVLDYENVVYQDKFEKRDITGCMLEVNLSDYDFLIATPPCNYYSRANYRRETSFYSQQTKHLLPDIIDKFWNTGKLFIVENVINKVLMKDIISNHLSKGGFYFEHGRHSYFTNIPFIASSVIISVPQVRYNVQNTTKSKRQGSDNVNNVFNYIIKELLESDKNI